MATIRERDMNGNSFRALNHPENFIIGRNGEISRTEIGRYPRQSDNRTKDVLREPLRLKVPVSCRCLVQGKAQKKSAQQGPPGYPEAKQNGQFANLENYYTRFRNPACVPEIIC
jgi:hypothetical protein